MKKISLAEYLRSLTAVLSDKYKVDEKTISAIRKLDPQVSSEKEVESFIRWVWEEFSSPRYKKKNFELKKMEAPDTGDEVHLTYEADKPTMISPLYGLLSATGKVIKVEPSEGPKSEKDRARAVMKKITYYKPVSIQRHKDDWRKSFLFSYNKPITIIKSDVPNDITGVEADSITVELDLKSWIKKYLSW